MNNKLTSPKALHDLHDKLASARDSKRITLAVCAGTGCTACGCASLVAELRKEIAAAKVESKVEIKLSGCHGLCDQGPLVLVNPEGILYLKVRSTDARQIVEETVKNGRAVESLLYKDPVSGKSIKLAKDIPFFQKQTQVLLAHNSMIDPTSINDYISLGGYESVARVLSAMQPEEVIQTVMKSGLRGRGGSGFPTARKWDHCRRAQGTPKTVVCNANDGDPGAFVDRTLLEGNPHAVIEGMMIGAFAMGAAEGYIYVRNEYPLAVRNLSLALQQARECGLLGENILGTSFSFNIELSRGGGAIVSGESTALIATMEGKMGEPRARYIHTVEQGLWDKPTNLNNVETWASIPVIFEKGADWFTKTGTAGSSGTKVLALTGRVTNSGVVEVPMGMTLRRIITEIGGGVPNGKKLKAVQLGGPSVGTLIADSADPDVRASLVAYGEIKEGQKITNLMDIPLEFDALTKAGAMMGGGGVVVMDSDTCMVDMAKYFLTYLQQESCGKCVPCREGLVVMLRILTRITEGEGTMDDLVSLDEMSQVISDTSLCQLGGLAPNSMLATIKYFHQEYVAHIREKRCPAGVCKGLAAHAKLEPVRA
jgi:NADH-quinone oxidoreductase subunit F